MNAFFIGTRERRRGALKVIGPSVGRCHGLNQKMIHRTEKTKKGLHLQRGQFVICCVKQLEPPQSNGNDLIVLLLLVDMQIHEESTATFDPTKWNLMNSCNERGVHFSLTQAKSDDELTKEKEWIESGRVWLQHSDGFTSARLDAVGDAPVEEGRVRLKLDGTGEVVVSVDEDEVVKANPPQFDLAEDLAQLRHLNEASLLHTLRCRYAASLPHTYAGQSLIVINPVTPLAVYSERVNLNSILISYWIFLIDFIFYVRFSSRILP